MKPLQKPIHKDTIGGGERTVDTIGIALTGLAVAGVAVHAGLTAAVHKDDKK
jgi:quinone-reactive Ni/Fe-hydrogenase small subunit/[NiFe] hydrogenase small subunit